MATLQLNNSFRKRTIGVWLCSAPWREYAYCAVGRAFLLQLHLLRFFYSLLVWKWIVAFDEPRPIFPFCWIKLLLVFGFYSPVNLQHPTHPEWIHLHARSLLLWYGILLYIFNDTKVNYPYVQLHMQRTGYTLRLYSMFYNRNHRHSCLGEKKKNISRNIK